MQFWLVLTVGIFIKLGLQIFRKLYGVFYVSFHEKNNQEKYYRINQKGNCHVVYDDCERGIGNKKENDGLPAIQVHYQGRLNVD